MGRLGLTEILILGTGGVVALLVFSWVRSTMARGKARYEAERQLRSPRTVVVPSAAEPAKPVAPLVVERERIIERQVVVTRCPFCKKLTPVDLSACDGCGARP